MIMGGSHAWQVWCVGLVVSCFGFRIFFNEAPHRDSKQPKSGTLRAPHLDGPNAIALHPEPIRFLFHEDSDNQVVVTGMARQRVTVHGIDPYELNGENMKKIFDGKKRAKLGTEKLPAMVHVQTEERMKELVALFEEKGWHYSIELQPDEPEDINDLEMLLNPPETRIAEQKVGRNDSCPCGSGKKYKKCCGQQ